MCRTGRTTYAGERWRVAIGGVALSFSRSKAWAEGYATPCSRWLDRPRGGGSNRDKLGETGEKVRAGGFALEMGPRWRRLPGLSSIWARGPHLEGRGLSGVPVLRAQGIGPLGVGRLVLE